MILRILRSITVLDVRLLGRRKRMKRNGGRQYLRLKYNSQMGRNTNRKVKNKENDRVILNHICKYYITYYS